jgi:hypothetical protein
LEEQLGDRVARRISADMGPSATGTSVKLDEGAKEEARGQGGALRKTAQCKVIEPGRLVTRGQKRMQSMWKRKNRLADVRNTTHLILQIGIGSQT